MTVMCLTTKATDIITTTKQTRAAAEE